MILLVDDTSDTREIYSLYLTAYPLHAVKSGLLETADGFLTKPCLPEDLEQHVQRLLGRRRSGP